MIKPCAGILGLSWLMIGSFLLSTTVYKYIYQFISAASGNERCSFSITTRPP